MVAMLPRHKQRRQQSLLHLQTFRLVDAEVAVGPKDRKQQHHWQVKCQEPWCHNDWHDVRGDTEDIEDVRSDNDARQKDIIAERVSAEFYATRR